MGRVVHLVVFDEIMIKHWSFIGIFYLVAVFGCSTSQEFTITYLDEKYSDDQSKFITIEGSRIHYKDQGNGMPLVLLHGIGSSLQTWDGWTKQLTDQFRIIRLDLPGFGLTGADSSNEYTMKRNILILHNFLDQLDVDQYYLAGNSLGGWLAWEYTLDYPDEVQKLILIDAAGFITPDNPPKPLRLLQKFKKDPSKGAPKFAIRKALKQAYVDKSKITDELVDRYFELNNRPGNPLAFYQMATTQYNPRTSRMPEITVPVLIMWGAEDKKWIDVSHAYLFQELLPNDELIIYDGLGHLPME
jgi:pimeloyl-ACP methyl ester carboxylesterase